MSNYSYVTEEGLKKMKDDLDHLVKVERPNASKQIAEARDKGDLSENAEYDAAKEYQGLLEMRISKLKEVIVNSRLIDNSLATDLTIVQILSKVKIKNTKNAATMDYMLVSESEADLKIGKISLSTPLAKALMGKKVGDIVEVKAPAGIMNFEIIEITR
jgi:transcription elongation factor GreA